MDARSFATFITKCLSDDLKIYEDNLVNGNYTDAHTAQRAVGARQTISAIISGMSNLVSKFYDQGGSAQGFNDSTPPIPAVTDSLTNQ